jgi:hypothetical protein
MAGAQQMELEWMSGTRAAQPLAMGIPHEHLFGYRMGV